MHDLAARCEAAEGPDRDLDEQIALAVGWTFHRDPLFDFWREPNRADEHEEPPAFTASVDCALTLIPDGMWWLIGKGRTRPDEPLYGVQILDGERVVAEAETEASAALAICAASLRARAG